MASLILDKSRETYTMIKNQAYIYSITGLSCTSCASSAQKVLGKIDGVEAVKVNFATQTVWFVSENLSLNIQELNQYLNPLGFGLKPKQKKSNKDTDSSKHRSHQYLIQLIIALTIGCILMSTNFIFDASIMLYCIQWLLSTIAIYFSGGQFFSSAFHLLRIKRANMDSLVALGVGTAYLASSVSLINGYYQNAGVPLFWYIDTAVMLLVFILFGKLLESRSLQKTSASIDELVALEPADVLLFKNGKTIEMPIEMIAVGDLIKVKTGGIIPLDGVNINESVSVDESLISGEMIPVLKEQGASCFAGSVLQQGVLLLEVTKTGEDTSLQQIIKLVEKAQNSQLPVQYLVDRLVQVFVPIVLFIAMLTFLMWAYNEMLLEGLVHAIAVLLVACPCALGLATPVAIVVGIGKAAQKGILFSRAAALQQLDAVDTILFDKTGTLTMGSPRVSSFERLDSGSSEDDDILIQMAATLESPSEHPLGRAIVMEAERRGLAVGVPTEFEAIPGQGVVGYVDGRRVEVMRDDLASCKMSIDAVPVGTFTVEDLPRPDSSDAIASLRELGVQVKMLTGDRRHAAEKIGEKIGLLPEDIIAEATPESKQKTVANSGPNVAMVGDGINDAAALASADLGIAMASGTGAAIETASIIVPEDRVSAVADAIRVAQKTLTCIRQNLFLAFVYNSAAIPIAAFGLLGMHGPLIAAVAMGLSDVSVIGNAIRLRGKLNRKNSSSLN